MQAGTMKGESTSMRMFILLLGFTVVLSTSAMSQDDCRCWTPSAQQIAAVEAKIEGRSIPLGTLDRYARYYAGVIGGTGERRFIRGKLVPLGSGDMPGLHIVEGKMPPLQQEGCISMSEAKGGPWLYFNCARRGAWTPAERLIAELEDVFRRRGGQLVSYARHYAGVTDGERRIIRGEYVSDRLGEKPGIYVASEAEIPEIFDGGCDVVHLSYDPSSKEMTSRCGGR